MVGHREDWGESQAVGYGGLDLGLTGLASCGAELHVTMRLGRVLDPLEELSAVSPE